MRLFIAASALVALAIACAIGASEYQPQPAEPTPVEKAVAELKAQFQEMRSGVELSSQQSSTVSADVKNDAQSAYNDFKSDLANYGRQLQSLTDDSKQRVDELQKAKAAADQADKSRAEENAKFLGNIEDRANAAIEKLEEHVNGLAAPGDHSILTEDEQREKFATDYPVIAKQIDQPKSCPLPEVGKADIEKLQQRLDDQQKQIDALRPKPVTKKAAPKTGIPGRMSAIAKGNRYAVAVIRQTNCVGCNDLERRAIHTPLWDAELSNAHCGWAIVNVDQEPAFRTYFRVPATPWGIAYDTDTDHWHSIAFNQNNQFDTDIVAVQKVQTAIAAIPN